MGIAPYAVGKHRAIRWADYQYWSGIIRWGCLHLAARICSSIISPTWFNAADEVNFVSCSLRLPSFPSSQSMRRSVLLTPSCRDCGTHNSSQSHENRTAGEAVMMGCQAHQSCSCFACVSAGSCDDRKEEHGGSGQPRSTRSSSQKAAEAAAAAGLQLRSRSRTPAQSTGHAPKGEGCLSCCALSSQLRPPDEWYAVIAAMLFALFCSTRQKQTCLLP